MDTRGPQALRMMIENLEMIESTVPLVVASDCYATESMDSDLRIRYNSTYQSPDNDARQRSHY